jgi:hypothetical protein
MRWKYSSSQSSGGDVGGLTKEFCTMAIVAMGEIPTRFCR